jgi:hypothetical protein
MPKVESDGCSSRADGSISCSIIITSGSPMWRHRYEFFSTHTTHAHTTLLSRVHTPSPGRLLLTSTGFHTLTHSDLIFRCHFTRDPVLIFICLYDRCVWVIQYPGYVGELACGIQRKSSPGCMKCNSALFGTMEKVIYYSLLHGEGDTPCPDHRESDRDLSIP